MDLDNSKPKLLVGLGNPGKKYQATRHNIGFHLIEEFCYKHNIQLKKETKFESEFVSAELDFNYKIKKNIRIEIPEEYAKTEIDPDTGNEITIMATKMRYEKKQITEEKSQKVKVFCALPQTYMNDSGRAITKIMKYFKIENNDLLIAHDDVTLDTGKLRMAFNRGAGGQHGIEDTIERLGGKKDFYRLKFGVGPDPGGERRADYVLSCFPKKEKELIDTTVNEALLMIHAWLLGEDHQKLSF